MRFTLVLPDGLYGALKVQAKSSGESMQSVVRAALREYLK